MNKARRARIQEIVNQLNTLKDEIESIKEEESEYAENLPDNFAEKKENAEAAVQLGEDALEELGTAADTIESVIDKLGEMQG